MVHAFSLEEPRALRQQQVLSFIVHGLRYPVLVAQFADLDVPAHALQHDVQLLLWVHCLRCVMKSAPGCLATSLI